MQLPGRLLMTHPAFTPGPYALLLSSFALQVAGLMALAMGGTGPSLWIGVTLFASGGGLSTLARPYLVLHTFGAERAGVMNGVIARGHQLARAAGPVSAAAVAGVTGYGGVFVGLAVLLMTALVLAPRRRPAALHM
jgi:hypothetical protein